MAPRKRDGAQKSAWKDKLTDEQLDRKRATDRQGVRESRLRSRQTIDVLERRIALLVNDRPEQLIKDLMHTNSMLEREREGLRQRFHAMCSVMGFSREDSTTALQGIVSDRPDDQQARDAGQSTQPAEQDTSRAEPQAAPQKILSEATKASTASTDLVDIINARMAIGQQSPYPQIRQAMSTNDAAHDMDEFVEAVMIWRQTVGCANLDVFELASRFFHVSEPPINLTRSRLRTISKLPHILKDITDDVEQIKPLLASFEDSATISTAAKTLRDTRIEAAVCAFVAIWPWSYSSKTARLLMFWALYRSLLFLALPTVKTLLKVPAWFRPVSSQLSNPHPSFIDFLPWPALRDQLVHNWKNYERGKLYSSIVEHLEVQLVRASPILKVSQSECEIELVSANAACFLDADSVRLRPDFFQDFPELIAFAPMSFGDTLGQVEISTNSPSASSSLGAGMQANTQSHPQPTALDISTPLLFDRAQDDQSHVAADRLLDTDNVDGLFHDAFAMEDIFQAGTDMGNGVRFLDKDINAHAIDHATLNRPEGHPPFPEDLSPANLPSTGPYSFHPSLLEPELSTMPWHLHQGSSLWGGGALAV